MKKLQAEQKGQRAPQTFFLRLTYSCSTNVLIRRSFFFIIRANVRSMHIFDSHASGTGPVRLATECMTMRYRARVNETQSQKWLLLRSQCSDAIMGIWPKARVYYNTLVPVAVMRGWKKEILRQVVHNLRGHECSKKSCRITVDILRPIVITRIEYFNVLRVVVHSTRFHTRGCVYSVNFVLFYDFSSRTCNHKY